MDKRVIFAVAGSGKTTYIIKSLDLDKRYLIITYTINNVQNIKAGVIRKFGYFPENIKLYSYYSFLYGFCYKPFLHSALGTRGINYNSKPSRFAKKTDRKYYIDDFHRLYSDRIAKLLLEGGTDKNIVHRIDKYYDYLFIDEIQDFGGNDFNLLKEISKTSAITLYVGDFFQHTFDTSRDGSVNSKLHDDYELYKVAFEKMGLNVDITTLARSFRCSPTICDFITENLNIKIESHRLDAVKIKLIDSIEDALSMFHNSGIVKLFYREHYKYSCFSRNWGESKGEDKYHDVCIVMNKSTMVQFKNKSLEKLPPMTKNKLYVALSRTKNNLYLLSETLLQQAIASVRSET